MTNNDIAETNSWFEIKDKIQAVVPWVFFYSKTHYIKSGDGYFLVCGYNRYKHVFIYGNVMIEDAIFDSPAQYYFQTKDNKVVDAPDMDFIFDYDQKRLKKIKQKNSTIRKVAQRHITIHNNQHNSGLKEEYQRLFEIWAKQTSSPRKPHSSVNLIDKYFNITYRACGKLVGLQCFAFVGQNIYCVVETTDHNVLGDTWICTVYPSALFKKPIHWFGSPDSSHPLYMHKVRKYHNNYVSFEKIVVPSAKQSLKLRKDRLAELSARLRENRS